MATIHPIWKPLIVDMSGELSSGAVEFSISTGGETIYEGKAYGDADDNCDVQINDIIRGHLGSFFPYPTTQRSLDLDAVRSFSVAYGTDGTTVKVLNDWSWDASRSWADNSPAVLTAPVLHWDYRTIRPFTVIGASTLAYTFYNAAGAVVSSGSTTIGTGSLTFFAAPTVPGSLKLTVGTVNFTYPIGEYCDKATLIYRNALGGFDVLPIASLVENEAYTRDTYDIRINNPLLTEHLRRDYRAAVLKSYTLRTPVLTDEEAAKMSNALGSLQAWLHTAERGYEAVLVRAGSWKRKTFKNEGRKRVTYEFDVQFAQPQERR